MTVDEHEVFTIYAKGRKLTLAQFACVAMKSEIRRRVRDKYWLRQAPANIVSEAKRIFSEPIEDGSVVYFIRDGDYVKIGVSGNVEKRMDAMLGHNPHEIELLACFPGTTRTEKALHALFAFCRYRREWFYATPQIYDFINAARENEGSSLFG